VEQLKKLSPPNPQFLSFSVPGNDRSIAEVPVSQKQRKPCGFEQIHVPHGPATAPGVCARPLRSNGESGSRNLSSPLALRIMRNSSTIPGLGSLLNDPTVVADLTLSAADPKLRCLLVRDDDFCAHE